MEALFTYREPQTIEQCELCFNFLLLLRRWPFVWCESDNDGSYTEVNLIIIS